VCVVLSTLPSYIALARAALRGNPSVERRQLLIVLVANMFTYAAIPADGALAYGIGVFPLSWLLAGIGSVLLARALVVEDLLRVRAIDNTMPQLVLHLAGSILLGWVALQLMSGSHAPWWLVTLLLALSFASVRVIVATIGLINRGARERASTLDRLLGQLVARTGGHGVMTVALR
jgi:predicted neutral ceramidase superfamily lipid hydrolase